MTDWVAHGKALPTEVVEQVVSKTDGVPLFVEELTKMVLESGLLQEREERYELTGPLPPLAIPATLHDSLMARLDRLATVKALAQLGATLGREFSYALLQAVSPWDEGTLQRGLHQLVEAEFLYQQGLPPQATYRFKHALIQEAAYQSLLRSTRQRHHQHIAQVLEAHFPDLCATQPELLAQHYTEAGLLAQAIPYWQRAGQHANERSAHVEAISHLTQGLALLQSLPETVEHTQWELALQMALGPALLATKGYGAPEVETTYTRARVLCQKVGETPQLFPALWGLWIFYLTRAEHHTAHALGTQLLSLAQHHHAPDLVLEAHAALGVSSLYLGAFAAAQAHLEHGIALYDPQQHREHTFRYGQDPGMFCHSYHAWALWPLGYPIQAVQHMHAALALVPDLAHPFSRAAALHYAARVHQFRREAQLTQETVETSVTLATEQGFAFWATTGTILRGWALSAQGQGAEGIRQMRQGLTAWRATGAAISLPNWLGLLAEAYGRVEQLAEGLPLLEEALVAVHSTGERFYEAELHRLKGELLLLATDKEAEAEACFQQALAVARRQQAKSWELRAAVSLARLWHQQGKCAEAHALLAPVYGWFTEGFDTTDLQEAKTLLEELSHEPL
jgi:predicted ATPase